MLTIAPAPLASIVGSTCLQVRNTLLRLMSICESQTSSAISTGPPAAEPPTLLTRMSMRAECARCTPAAMAATLSLLVTSQAQGVIEARTAPASSSVSSRRSRSRSTAKHLGAFFGQAHGDGAAIAPAGADAARAGHDGDLVFESGGSLHVSESVESLRVVDHQALARGLRWARSRRSARPVVPRRATGPAWLGCGQSLPQTTRSPNSAISVLAKGCAST